MSRPRVKMAVGGFLGGIVLGATLWSSMQHRRKRDLFSKRPMHRLAALTYLRGQASGPETVRLLREYVRWESSPGLRRRASELLARVERHFA
jgi:hypothetical protein